MPSPVPSLRDPFSMSQLRFSDAEFAGKRKQTRREVFLTELDAVIPWARPAALIDPGYLKAGNGRRPYPPETMLRIHVMTQWQSDNRGGGEKVERKCSYR